MPTTITRGRDETLLTDSQVAARCNLSVYALYRLRVRGLGPESVLTSEGRRYRAADVDAWNQTRDDIDPDDDRYMTIAETREKLRCSRWTVSRRISDGDIIARKIEWGNGRGVWVDRESVERYLARQIVTPQ